MRSVITVIGKDKVGIIAGVSDILAKENVNILDISQTIMQGFFTMVMLVDLEQSKLPLVELSDKLLEKGAEMGVEIKLQHEDIFNSMHRI
ncbi:ACT domain-containing protein [Clostridium sp. USBA 49]|uniref:ACT domain-containing protein n=1 Tax=Clostridium TaxID=1485 RepID=UPI00099934C9|nr:MULTISPECIES: ACT domain-containing protein [Clostridium]SKA82482.1 ACT domain-containing protein [Clostridium sp. USBA 49]